MNNIVAPSVAPTPMAPNLNPGAIDYSWLQGDKPTQNLMAPMTAPMAPMGMASMGGYSAPYGAPYEGGGAGPGEGGGEGQGASENSGVGEGGNSGEGGAGGGAHGGLVSSYRHGGPVHPPYREEARQVANQGRGPDTMLMHVTPKELRGLASLHPSGQLPRNPQTGLPEAGFLENVLPGILGTAIGSFVGMPWLGAAIGGIGTGLATGDLSKGILSGLMSFGLGTAFSGLAEAGAGAGIASTKTAEVAAAANAGGDKLLGGAGALQASNEAARNTFNEVSLGTNSMGTGPTPPIEANLGSITRNQSINSNMGFLDRAAQGISNIPNKLSNIPNTLSNIGTGLSDPKALMAAALPAASGLFSGYGLYQASQPPAPPWTPAIPQQPTGPTRPTPTNLRTPTGYAPTVATGYGSRGGEGTFFTPNPGFPYMAAGGGHIKALATGGVIPRGYDSYEMARGGVASMPSGMIRGPGAGMDDAINGTIDGRREVRLSDGEYVLSADVVSSIGDGSSEAGARRLGKMVANIREKKYGRPKQPGKLAGGLASLGMQAGGLAKEKYTPPEPLPYPSKVEVEEARDYKRRFGNENEFMFEGPRTGTFPARENVRHQGTVMDVIDPSFLLNGKPLTNRPPLREELTEESADKLYAAQMAAMRSPIAYLGLDPHNTIVTQSNSEESKLNAEGAHEDGLTWIDLRGGRSASVHEDTHRGLKQINFLQDVQDRDTNEMVVRYLMSKYFPGQEESEDGGGGIEQIKQAKRIFGGDSPRAISNRKIIEKAERKANEKIARRLMERYPFSIGATQ